MKQAFGLSLLLLATAPLAHAADILPCNRIETRVLQLDRQILCESRNGGNPSLSLMLERNYLAEMHNSINCRSKELVLPAMSLRDGSKRLDCSNLQQAR